jgi:hypothetical protein
MDDDNLISRLGALLPPEVEASRRRAMLAVPVRVAQLRSARHPWRGRRPLMVVAAVAALAAAIILVVSLGGGAPGEPTPAYAGELIRFAESTPLLLLEGPGWHVQNANQKKTRKGSEGRMEFVTGRPIRPRTIKVTGNVREGLLASGLAPVAVRQRRVVLLWRHEDLAKALSKARHQPHVHGQRWTQAPVLGTTAHVDERDEPFVNQGGPGDRQMTAYWSEGGYLLEMRAAVPDLSAFEDRLAWLTKVDSESWIKAMPQMVVHAAELDGTVRQMLEGIPVPRTFAISRIPDDGLRSNQELLSTSVAGTVACLWFRQWGQAIRTGDEASKLEAQAAMATAPHWRIMVEMPPSNGWAPLLFELAAGMPRGYTDLEGNKEAVLHRAENLGCASFGLPVLPEKMKRQRERGVPPPGL